VVPEFVPGLQLARGFYATVVRPLLEEQFSQVPYAAALLGPGSEVAGFDSPRSTDHDWGPRLQIFLSDGDADRHGTALTAMLASRLPESFRGYPVAFPVTREPGGTARNRVEVTGLGPWLTSQLGFDPRHAVTLLDWLALVDSPHPWRPRCPLAAGPHASSTCARPTRPSPRGTTSWDSPGR
jgi:hypothetical protein